MKAIKLASVFAVSAVAAAVSTTTLAAEPVFKGSAGLEYKSVDEASDSAGSNGEVNIIGDTGLVYFDLDMDTGAGNFVLDEIYVKQGAVQFGDFDGSLADAAAYSAGVQEDNDGAKQTLGTDLGIRYMVSDELTVAVEMEEGENNGSVGVAFETNAGGVDLGVSAGVGSDDSIITLGASAPLGMASISAFYQTGELAEADVTNYGVGLDVALSESLSAAFQYYTQDGEETAGTDYEDQGITEATLNYTMGDIRYYATFVTYEDDGEDNYSVVGAEATF